VLEDVCIKLLTTADIGFRSRLTPKPISNNPLTRLRAVRKRGQVNPSVTIWATRRTSSRPHFASGFQGS